MAFVHLHNHSDFSILDAATRVSDMVKRAVDLGMPALALTDHGYMFGIPDFDLECRKYNDGQKDMHQWKHDLECFQKGWELEEPEPDAEDAPLHDRVHAQWASDVKIWNETGDLEAIMEGVELEDGFVKADDVRVAEDDKTQVGIEIHSGKNRIVRRIFEHFGYQILRLDRVFFAGITKKNLPRGHWRFLTREEVSVLKTY